MQPMESFDLGLPPCQTVTSDGATIEPRGPGGDRPCSLRQIAAIALTAGVAAGLVSWIAGERAHDVFRPRLFEVPKWEAVCRMGTHLSLNMPLILQERGPGQWGPGAAQPDLRWDSRAVCRARTVARHLRRSGSAGFGIVHGAPGGAGRHSRLPSRLAATVPNGHERRVVAARDACRHLDDDWRRRRGGLRDRTGVQVTPPQCHRDRDRRRIAGRSRLPVDLVYARLASAGATGLSHACCVVRLMATLLPISMIVAGAALGTLGHLRPPDPNHGPGPADGCRSPLDTSSRLPT